MLLKSEFGEGDTVGLYEGKGEIEAVGAGVGVAVGVEVGLGVFVGVLVGVFVGVLVGSSDQVAVAVLGLFITMTSE